MRANSGTGDTNIVGASSHGPNKVTASRTHTHTHTHTHTRTTHIYTHAHTHTYTLTYTQTHKHKHTHTHTCPRTHSRTHIHKHAQGLMRANSGTGDTNIVGASSHGPNKVTASRTVSCSVMPQFGGRQAAATAALQVLQCVGFTSFFNCRRGRKCLVVLVGGWMVVMDVWEGGCGLICVMPF